jgi:putative colanic acid biosynthesis UDP-glucose lipid carrier transferase
MGDQSKYLLRIIIFSVDMAVVNLALLLLMPIGNSLYHTSFNSLDLVNILTYNLLWIGSAYYCRLYSIPTLSSIEKILRQTIHSFVLFASCYFVFISFVYSFNIAIKLLPIYGLLMILSTMVSRFFLTYVVDFVIRKANLYQKIVIVGYNDTARKLAEYLTTQNKLYSFEGFFNTHENMLVESDGTIVRPLHTCMEYAVRNDVREIYSTLLPEEHHEIDQLLAAAEMNCVRVKFVPAYFPDEVLANTRNLEMERFHFLQQIHPIGLKAEPLYNYESRLKKRIFDILFSSFVIIFITSWLFPILALLIKLESRGPIFFKQLRTGKNKMPFYCYKFRSMYVNNDSDLKQCAPGDSRITRIGRILRKTSLDELPQFFNVLIGNMSVVGPRPHMVKQTEQYSAIINRYMVRQFLKPGITGWAQVNGYRGETRNPMLMQRRVEHDIWYMERWSTALDVRIVFMTIINVIKCEETAV